MPELIKKFWTDLSYRKQVAMSVTAPSPRLWTREEYYKMAEAGVFRPDERVELIGGRIVTMSPQNSPHFTAICLVEDGFRTIFGTGYVVRVQGPLDLSPSSQPEPDIAVVRPRADYYRKRHPQPADIFMLFEVMETSAAYDRGVKLSSYARSGIPEVWLVDLGGDVIQAHRQPFGGVYTQSQSYARGQSVSCEAFPDLVLNVDDILG